MNFEFDCGTATGYKVTIKSKSLASVLKICSVGILSMCSCAESSFLDADMKDYAPNVSETTLNATLNGVPVYSAVKTEDSISYICGSGDGKSYCGPRTIKLIELETGLVVN